MHRSNAQELIAKVPIIEVDADTTLCDGGVCARASPCDRGLRRCARGWSAWRSQPHMRRAVYVRGAGGGATGHPIEYIELNRCDPVAVRSPQRRALRATRCGDIMRLGLRCPALRRRGGIAPVACKYCGLRFQRKPHHH